ncbi:MAG TPA: TIGR02996 domain-containing protein [Enhygromyxa sp.]|nr:TIGR02996 domain-containing protein [Enhygromyxa sp.]
MIEAYEHRWMWQYLRNNDGLPWTIELIRHYVGLGKWTWMDLQQPWAFQHPELLASCLEQWHDYYGACSVDWGPDADEWAPELVERCKNLRWDRFARIESFPWTIEFIARHQDRLDWQQLSCNPGLPWSLELFETFEHRWDWHNLAQCQPTWWPADLVELLASRGLLSWSELCFRNCEIWDRPFLEDHRARLDLDMLARNPDFPWDQHLEWFIDSLDDPGQLDWQSLSSNPELTLNLETLRRYADYWNLDYLSDRRAPGIEMIEFMRERWTPGHWERLSRNVALSVAEANPELPWSWELVIAYNAGAVCASLQPAVVEQFAATLSGAPDEPREAALEAALAREPDLDDHYLVYADWLEARGDPQALLIRVMADESEGVDRELIQASMRAYQHALGQRSWFRLTWRGGFVHKAFGLHRHWRSLLRRRAFFLVEVIEFDLGNEAPLVDDDLELLRPLQRLSRLRCSDSSIRDLSVFAELPRLTSLSLADSPVADLAPLRGCGRLVELDLRRTEVRDLSPLHGLRELRRLYLDDGQLGADELRRLRDALPELEIGDDPRRGIVDGQ